MSFIRSAISIFLTFALCSCFSTSLEKGENPWPNWQHLTVSDKYEKEGVVYYSLRNQSDKDVVITLAQGLPLPPFHFFKGARFPGEGGTCETTISAETTCLIVVEKEIPWGLAFLDKSLKTWRSLTSNPEESSP